MKEITLEKILEVTEKDFHNTWTVLIGIIKRLSEPSPEEGELYKRVLQRLYDNGYVNTNITREDLAKALSKEKVLPEVLSESDIEYLTIRTDDGESIRLSDGEINRVNDWLKAKHAGEL